MYVLDKYALELLYLCIVNLSFSLPIRYSRALSSFLICLSFVSVIIPKSNSELWVLCVDETQVGISVFTYILSCWLSWLSTFPVIIRISVFFPVIEGRKKIKLPKRFLPIGSFVKVHDPSTLLQWFRGSAFGEQFRRLISLGHDLASPPLIIAISQLERWYRLTRNKQDISQLVTSHTDSCHCECPYYHFLYTRRT